MQQTQFTQKNLSPLARVWRLLCADPILSLSAALLLGGVFAGAAGLLYVLRPDPVATSPTFTVPTINKLMVVNPMLVFFFYGALLFTAGLVLRAWRVYGGGVLAGAILLAAAAVVLAVAVLIYIGAEPHKNVFDPTFDEITRKWVYPLFKLYLVSPFLPLLCILGLGLMTFGFANEARIYWLAVFTAVCGALGFVLFAAAHGIVYNGVNYGVDADALVIAPSVFMLVTAVTLIVYNPQPRPRRQLTVNNEQLTAGDAGADSQPPAAAGMAGSVDTAAVPAEQPANDSLPFAGGEAYQDDAEYEDDAPDNGDAGPNL